LIKAAWKGCACVRVRTLLGRAPELRTNILLKNEGAADPHVDGLLPKAGKEQGITSS
jgi:hypothetical protein